MSMILFPGKTILILQKDDTKPVLKDLINIRLKDAQVLSKNRRYQAAVYMSGYAMEIALKLKICHMFLFQKGFPETKKEFSDYRLPSSKRNLGVVINDLKEIRHHGLSKLLFYSGAELRVKQTFLNEW